MDTVKSVYTYTKQNERHIVFVLLIKIWRISVSGQSKNAFLCLLKHKLCLNNCKDTFFLQYDALMRVLFFLKRFFKISEKYILIRMGFIITSKINFTATTPTAAT